MVLLLASQAWAIKDGVEDVEDTAVVGIIDSYTSAQCTGTLIAPDVVLTARHCVSEFVGVGCDATWGATSDAERFYVTTRPAFSFDVGDYHPVSAVVVDKARSELCGGDVAILVLADSVSGDEAEPIAPRVDDAAVEGEAYSAVGYGATDDFGTGSGTRRRRDGLAVACVGDCSSLGAAAAEWVGEAGVCVGDSGGPALDASGRVIGVASRGAVGCVSPVYASLAADGWADFLRETVANAAESGGYEAPDWVGGEDTDEPGGKDTPETGGGDTDGAEGGDTDPGGDSGSGDSGESSPDDEGAGAKPTDGCGGCGAGAGAPAAATAALAMALARGRASRRRR